MASIARLENVTKTYHLGTERSNWRALIPGPRGDASPQQSFDALRDVSLTIEKGDALGIIGRNGAGKSTILKLLAGVTAPSKGTVEVDGTVAAVIELGVGFDPEMTGADNLRFAATLLGHTGSELEERWDDIVAFAELERFLDTPMKRYSTGMKARLGFSLITSFPADVVLIDEALSVGDWSFQSRSLDRIQRLHEEGATIIAVSHSNWMLGQMCDSMVLIDDGQVITSGDPVAVISSYTGPETIGVGDPGPVERLVGDVYHTADGPVPVTVEDLVVHDDRIDPGAPLAFSFDLVVHEPAEGLILASFYTMGRAAFAEPSEGPSELLQRPGRWRISGRITQLPVAPGPYHFRIALASKIEEDDHDQEYRDAWSTATAPFTIVGEVTRRPGLMLDVVWEHTSAVGVEAR